MNGLLARGLGIIFVSAITVTSVGTASAGQPAGKVKGVKDVRNESQVGGKPVKDVKTATSVQCETEPVQPINGVASDPEEGGQVATSEKGSGKVTFNPFSITRKIDKSSPVFFRSANGCH